MMVAWQRVKELLKRSSEFHVGIEPTTSVTPVRMLQRHRATRIPGELICDRSLKKKQQQQQQTKQNKNKIAIRIWKSCSRTELLYTPDSPTVSLKSRFLIVHIETKIAANHYWSPSLRCHSLTEYVVYKWRLGIHEMTSNVKRAY